MAYEQRTCVIAEAGVNHNGSMELALKLIKVAAESGADIVKFQTFKASSLTTAAAPKAEYQSRNVGTSDSQQLMLKKLELSESDHFRLASYCKDLGVEFLSTPFDEQSLDFLTRHRLIRRIKIPSGEITNLPFLLRISRSGLPIILSTGMATLGEIELAMMCLAYGLINREGTPDRMSLLRAYTSPEGQAAVKENVCILHCTTEYPAPLSEVNLQAIQTLRQAFQVRVGYSDHTEGIAIPIAATALGASIIEKHYTIDKNMEGPDHKASLDPDELSEMVRGIRKIEQSLGTAVKYPSKSELLNRPIARKSVVASKFIPKGTKFSVDNLICKRPGSGIPASEFWDLLGKIAHRDFRADELINLRDD